MLSNGVIEFNYQQRINQLEVIARDEDIFVSDKSRNDFWLFIQDYRPSPQAGLILTDDGNLVAIWRGSGVSIVEIEFLGNDQCNLIIFREPNSPLCYLPEITTDTLIYIGERIGDYCDEDTTQ